LNVSEMILNKEQKKQLLQLLIEGLKGEGFHLVQKENTIYAVDQEWKTFSSTNFKIMLSLLISQLGLKFKVVDWLEWLVIAKS